jgi:hypothetical protein
MSAVLDKSTNPGNRGSHYNKGAEYLYYVNESTPQVWRQPVNPATTILQQVAKPLLGGQVNNLNSLGASDLRWTGTGTKQLQGQSGAKLFKLTGFTTLEQIQPEALAAVAWDSLPANNTLANEDGQSAAGNFYAVKIPLSGGDAHYAKVRIFKDTATRIEWVAYVLGTRPSVLHTLGTEITSPRDIFVTDFDTEIYVSGGDVFGYVVKYQRILGGPFPQYFDFPIQLNAFPLASPQQMIVDGGTIYVVAEDGLFLLQPEYGVQIQVVTGISAPVGLLLDKKGATHTAYISTTVGQVYVVDLSQFNAPTFDSDGNQTGAANAPIAAPEPRADLALGGASGFLTWADDAHTAFYAPVVGAAGKIHRVDLVANALSSELRTADPALPNPWSVEVFSEGSLSVVCDEGIYDIERGLSITADLALGLGLIPFDYINNSKENPASPGPLDGRANTSSAPGYYFSGNPNLAFGGSLTLLINHQAAWNSNLRFYKVSLTNDATGQVRNITDAFTDLLWKSSLERPRFDAEITRAQSGFFPIRNPAQLWYNPFLAAIIGTALSDNGYNRLKIDFFGSSTATSAISYTRLIYVDNTRSTVTLRYLRRGTSASAPAAGDYSAPEACGLIEYTNKDDLVEFDFTAVHPAGAGKYTIYFNRGSTRLFTLTGDVTTGATLLTVRERSPGVPLRIGHLTGNCDIAGISVGLSTPSPGVINGYGWVNLGDSASRGFSLAKAPLTHTDWPSALPIGTPAPRSALVMGPPLAKK